MQPRGWCVPASGRSASDALLDHVEKALAQCLPRRRDRAAATVLRSATTQIHAPPTTRDIPHPGDARPAALPPRPSGRGPRSATGTGRARCARRSSDRAYPTPPWARQTPCERAPFAFARNADNPCRPRAGSRAPRPRAGACEACRQARLPSPRPPPIVPPPAPPRATRAGSRSAGKRHSARRPHGVSLRATRLHRDRRRVQVRCPHPAMLDANLHDDTCCAVSVSSYCFHETFHMWTPSIISAIFCGRCTQIEKEPVLRAF